MATRILMLRRFAQSYALLRPTTHRIVTSYRAQHSQSDPKNRPRGENMSLVNIDDTFRNVPEEDRNKATFLAAIDLFKKRSKDGRGHVEFIRSALKHMKEYNLHKDIEIYKALLEVFPKGPLIAKNKYQRTFLHYPLQQHCCVKILDEMEWHSVYPDKHIFEIVKATFGDWAFATKKIRRMFYWNPKLRYSNKYLDRKLQENRHADLSFIERARMALEMMSRDKGNQISYARVASDNSLIISAQSPLQRRLIRSYEPANTCYYVNGPFDVYVAEKAIKYVSFTRDPGPNSERLLDKFIDHKEIEDIDKVQFYDGPFEQPPECGTVHEQIDQTILALGVLEKNTENSASAWVNHLQIKTPSLKDSTVILRIKSEEE